MGSRGPLPRRAKARCALGRVQGSALALSSFPRLPWVNDLPVDKECAAMPPSAGRFKQAEFLSPVEGRSGRAEREPCHQS